MEEDLSIVSYLEEPPSPADNEGTLIIHVFNTVLISFFIAELEWLQNYNQGKYVVRLYRHKKSTNRDKSVRSDFSKTLFWAGQIETNNAGEATVNFTLSESITSFRFMVDAFNRNNGFGVSDFLINSTEPFSSDARVPIEVTETDEILLPILLVNNTKKTFNEAKVSIATDSILQVDAKKAAEFKSIKMAGNQRGTLSRTKNGKFPNLKQ